MVWLILFKSCCEKLSIHNKTYTCKNQMGYFIGLKIGVGSRSPVTFKAKLSLTAVNRSFQLFPIFCRKELHICCIGLELNISIWTTKIQGVSGYWGLALMIECSYGKIWKTHYPSCPKNTFPEVFHIKFFHMSNKLNDVIINSLI